MKPCHYLRLTVPQNGSLIKIPNGDRVRNFFFSRQNLILNLVRRFKTSTSKHGTTTTLLMRFPIFNERCMLTTYSLYKPALISVEIKILRQLTNLRWLKGHFSKKLLTGLFYYFAHFFISFLSFKTLPYL